VPASARRWWDALLGRRAPAHGWLRLPPNPDGDVAVKPAAYLPIYEDILGPLRREPLKLLELGVWKGDSLALWRDALPRATIVGVDLVPVELELGPRVHMLVGDQGDPEVFARARAAHAPDGFDVIIDDASHVGRLAARSLQALYSAHLRPGGLYIIEDWGTGYLTAWPDGAAPSVAVGRAALDQPATPPSAGVHRLPSHDVGLVGLVKRLVDHTAAGTLAVHQPDWLDDPLDIEWMRITDGLVILKKPARRRVGTRDR
jgi:SAM-dependent methyltransferase